MPSSFSLKQKIFIVKRYYQGGNSVKIVQNDFPSEFRRKQFPEDDLILDLVKCFEEFGSILIENKKLKVYDKETPEPESQYTNVKEESCVTEDEIIFSEPFVLIKSELETSTVNEIENLVEDEIERKVEEKIELNEEKSNSTEVLKKSKKVHKCEECEKVFIRKRNYDRHIESHRKTCKLCCKKYRDYDNHMLKKHSSEKPFHCVKCGSQFKEQHRLNTHMKNHSEETPFSCDVCQKSFKTKDYLRSHSKFHLTARPAKCQICGKGFIDNSTLRKHARVHSDQRQFICSFCGKTFKTGNSLTYHNRIHTGEKPFSCNLCDKKFSARSILKVHTRIHTGERPFICPVCDKSFYDLGTCKVHQRTHTGDYPFVCHLCGKRHNHPNNLKSHLRHGHKVDLTNIETKAVNAIIDII